MSYDKLIVISELDFRDKSILLIGGGWMAEQYYDALKAFGVEKVDVITNSEKTASKWKNERNLKAFSGGYKKVLPDLSNPFDLVIVATPVDQLQPAATEAIRAGNKNILVEKPADLYSSSLKEWEKKISDDVRVRIAYNRLAYPSFWKLKEIVARNNKTITSCFYTFTEWVHTIDFNNNQPECYQRWGIANSLHVISMAHSLIGLPAELSTRRAGSIPWHTAGSRFTGAGVTDQNVMFSYHANWQSAGRWGVEIMTDAGAYRLIPLEELFCCDKGSVEWNPVEINPAFPECKVGVAEELAVMLAPELEDSIELVTLEKAISFTELAENIFGYSQ